MSESDPAPADDLLPGIVGRPTLRWRAGERSTVIDRIAEEVPVAMRYNGVAFSVMMATPADLEDFALGFSMSEGLIQHASELLGVEVRPCIEGIELCMRVSHTAPVTSLPPAAARGLPGRSGCGLCGARQLEDVMRMPPPLESPATYPVASLRFALASLGRMQPLNTLAGSTHAAAWVDRNGRIVLVREDVGRHNALDKLAGAMHRQSLSTEAGLVLISSRASYEMVSKAAHAGMAIVAAVSAPTALAIDLAKAAGICLVGFARQDGFNVYAHPERLLGFETDTPLC
ncbi:formate dehydrogenase accessory sulfurtransferase FdhD [Stenotrophomonas sp. LARHCG68]